MDRLAAMAAFVKIVEAGSLSRAAELLGTSLPTVSRTLALLEERLGARLIARTTRRMSLTEPGRAYYERSRRILGAVEEAEATAASLHAAPAGTLVVAAPLLLGRARIAGLVPDFLARHPKLSIDLRLADRLVSLTEEEIDVAIRVGELADSSLVARRLGAFRRVVCGTPAYMARAGAPAHPNDLGRHNCLLFTALATSDEWRFREPGGAREFAVRVSGNFWTSSADAALEAALAGLGLALAPSWQVGEHVKAGRLVCVLDEFEPPLTPVHALYPHARLLSAKVRAFVDYLVARMGADDFWSFTPPGAIDRGAGRPSRASTLKGRRRAGASRGAAPRR
ncbi:MAG: LysR family transcriptional regulator, partial [Alphaproteobacteria bacterium]